MDFIAVSQVIVWKFAKYSNQLPIKLVLGSFWGSCIARKRGEVRRSNLSKRTN